VKTASKNYTFNASDIEVEARTGAVRKLIDYRKPVPARYKNTKVPGNVWCISRVRYRMPEYEKHPSQKPEALLERIIKASSNPGDLVLDPFGGVFTAAAVAQKLGRRSISIEQNPEYLKIGLRRPGIADHIERILTTHSGSMAPDVFRASPLLGYLNHKTRSATRGSKARGSFANHYALYVIVEDYILKGFAPNGARHGKYSDYEGARFSDLFRRQRELPFGLSSRRIGTREKFHHYIRDLLLASRG
jgi:hypothetical protein